MLNNIFSGIFDSTSSAVISVKDFILCIAVSLVLGIALACAYRFRSRNSNTFTVTLSLLPAAVCVVIMLVNGNIGAGVAVAGAFGLVRFRSAPGTAKEIVALFIAMAIGLIAGMGYLAFAALFTVILGAALMIFNAYDSAKDKKPLKEKVLRIAIPEDLNYTKVFDPILDEYTSYHKLTLVKTADLGSVFKLKYNITLKDTEKEKELIDVLRERNGNLEISVFDQESGGAAEL